ADALAVRAGLRRRLPVHVRAGDRADGRATIGPAERLLNMLGQQRRCALVYAAAFALHPGQCVTLAPRYGGLGAACATAAAMVLESALLFLVARRRLGLRMLIWRPGA